MAVPLMPLQRPEIRCHPPHAEPGRMINSRTTIAILACLSAVAFSVSGVSAQGGGADPGAPSTSVLPEGSASSTTSVASESSLPVTVPTSTPDQTSSPTTTYLPPIPDELINDPRVPFLVDPGDGDGIDVPIAQFSFDPQSVAVLPERVAGAQAALLESQANLDQIQQRVAEKTQSVLDLTAELEQLSAGVRTAVTKTATARRRLRDHAVTAYVQGRAEDKLALLNNNDFVDIGVARSYLAVVARQHDRLLRNYERQSNALGTSEARLASDLGVAQSVLAQTSAQVQPAVEAVAAATAQLQAYQSGAHAYINGFVFPVASEVEFIDSWGYPRMTGTPSAHWHQGTDIFADYGTPLIASENGTIARVGTGTLGGNKLWVVGESGTEYYYAHLSAFAPGVSDGMRVTAGQLVGYVGDTGNARGTSPHLHFEVHPGGGDAVNPYPLLKAAYGNRTVFRATAPAAEPAAVPTPEQAAEQAAAPATDQAVGAAPEAGVGG
ncbi:MAG: peptidoglycan DD-metalloendopeptidase family protein [Actinobacteria bacterium]|nr:peptidoglycan DD-metalloendopeptidase family protein [Actinomycetota bacterium]